MKTKRFSALKGAEFDKFLTDFSELQGRIRQSKNAPRTSLALPSPVWIGFICQPTKFEKEFFVVEDGLGRAIGRIGANLSASRPFEGAIGFFEVDLQHPEGRQAGAELLQAAESWLKSQGVGLANGPMNFSIWSAHGFRLQPSTEGEVSFSWETSQPYEYASIWEEAGYMQVETFQSTAFDDVNGLVQRTSFSFEAMSRNGFTFKAFDPTHLSPEELRTIHALSMEGLEEMPFFEPISVEAFRAVDVTIKGKPRPNLANIAYNPEGEAIAYVLGFEENGYLVIKREVALATNQELQVIEALQNIAARSAVALGLTKFVTASKHVDFDDETMATKDAKLAWKCSFGLFSKPIVD